MWLTNGVYEFVAILDEYSNAAFPIFWMLISNLSLPMQIFDSTLQVLLSINDLKLLLSTAMRVLHLQNGLDMVLVNVAVKLAAAQKFGGVFITMEKGLPAILQYIVASSSEKECLSNFVLSKLALNGLVVGVRSFNSLYSNILWINSFCRVGALRLFWQTSSIPSRDLDVPRSFRIKRLLNLLFSWLIFSFDFCKYNHSSTKPTEMISFPWK